jgi:apolipoprotein N-acyltransferase
MTIRRAKAKALRMPTSSAWRVYPFSFILGAAAACGFAPLQWWTLTLIAVAALAWLLREARDGRRAALIGWWFGLGHFCVGLNWIATAFTYQAAMPAWLGWVAVLLLSLYLALFPALAAGGAWVLARGGRALPPMLAGCWIVGELLRATLFTGFAWNPLAAIWAPVPAARALLPLVGSYGLSGLTVLLAALVAEIARGAKAGQRGWGTLSASAAVILLLVVAALIRVPPEKPGAGAPMLHVVQPNIGQALKWDPAAEAVNFRKLASLTGAPDTVPRIVLWPEVAVPGLIGQDAGARAELARLLGPRDLMLTGAEWINFGSDGYAESATNSLFGLDARGRVLGRYDKSHLVPYGEYLPMRPILSALGLSRLAPGALDFDAGPGPRNVPLPGIGTVGIQICYEIIFSGQVVDPAARPRFLFNPSNDAWFGAWGPPQHLAQARLRAAEEGLPVVRSTPTGISAVIDADGALVAALPWRTAGALHTPLPPTHAATPFARAGNILPLLLAIFLVAIGFASRRRPS